MSRASLVQRQKKREKLVRRKLETRSLLLATVKSVNASLEEKLEAQVKLQKLPRDSSRVRMRNRCSITGRPRGYYRKFGLSRNKIREAAMRGEIPGLLKASW